MWFRGVLGSAGKWLDLMTLKIFFPPNNFYDSKENRIPLQKCGGIEQAFYLSLKNVTICNFLKSPFIMA